MRRTPKRLGRPPSKFADKIRAETTAQIRKNASIVAFFRRVATQFGLTADVLMDGAENLAGLGHPAEATRWSSCAREARLLANSSQVLMGIAIDPQVAWTEHARQLGEFVGHGNGVVQAIAMPLVLERLGGIRGEEPIGGRPEKWLEVALDCLSISEVLPGQDEPAGPAFKAFQLHIGAADGTITATRAPIEAVADHLLKRSNGNTIHRREGVTSKLAEGESR